jgi:hypothetical protein
MKFKSTLLILGAMVIGGTPIYASAPEQKQPLMCPTADSIRAAVYSTRSDAEFRSKEFTVEKQTFVVSMSSYRNTKSENEEQAPNRLATENPTEIWKEVTNLVSQIATPQMPTAHDACVYHFTQEPKFFAVVLEKKKP